MRPTGRVVGNLWQHVQPCVAESLAPTTLPVSLTTMVTGQKGPAGIPGKLTELLCFRLERGANRTAVRKHMF